VVNIQCRRVNAKRNLEEYIQNHKLTFEIPNFLDDEQLMQQQCFLKLDPLTTTGYPKPHHHISHIKICLKKERNNWPLNATFYKISTQLHVSTSRGHCQANFRTYRYFIKGCCVQWSFVYIFLYTATHNGMHYFKIKIPFLTSTASNGMYSEKLLKFFVCYWWSPVYS